jgi:hypothetical protein
MSREIDIVPQHIQEASAAALEACDGLDAGEAASAIMETLATILADAGVTDEGAASFLETAGKVLPGRIRSIRAAMIARAH